MARQLSGAPRPPQLSPSRFVAARCARKGNRLPFARFPERRERPSKAGQEIEMSSPQRKIGLVFIPGFADWEYGLLSASAVEWFGAKAICLTPDGQPVVP